MNIQLYIRVAAWLSCQASVLFGTLPSPMASSRLQLECWNSIWNPPDWSESIIPPDSNGIQVEFHSNRFQVHSPGFQGPFQHIPSSFSWIPTHSNPFQPIPTHSMGHSNTFQHIPGGILFQWIPSAIQMSCDLV